MSHITEMPLATDHRQEQRNDDRMYRMERDSFEYQRQCDRYND